MSYAVAAGFNRTAVLFDECSNDGKAYPQTAIVRGRLGEQLEDMR